VGFNGVADITGLCWFV